MATPSKTPITWRDTESGAHGIVTSGFSTPHYLEVDKNGRWALSTLDANDKPVFVKQGHARNVRQAQRAAELAVRALVEGDTLTADTKADTKRDDVTPAIRMLKIYVGLSLVVLACLIFGRWLLLYRPVLLFRIVSWGSTSVFLAHRLIVFMSNAAARVDYLAGRRASPPVAPAKPKQQPMTLPNLPKRKALPAGRKR